MMSNSFAICKLRAMHASTISYSIGHIVYRLLFGQYLGFLPNTWEILFQIYLVNCSWETVTLQYLSHIWISKHCFDRLIWRPLAKLLTSHFSCFMLRQQEPLFHLLGLSSNFFDKLDKSQCCHRFGSHNNKC